MKQISRDALTPMQITAEDTREIVRLTLGDTYCERYYDVDERTQKYCQAMFETHAHLASVPILSAVLRLSAAVANHMSMTMWNTALRMSGPVGVMYVNNSDVSEEDLKQSADDLRVVVNDLMDALGVEFEDSFDFDLGSLLVKLASGQVVLYHMDQTSEEG